MSDAGAADEWDLVVPGDDAELGAELRRHGIKPGQRVNVRSALSGKVRSRSAISGNYVTKGSKAAGGAQSTDDGGPDESAPEGSSNQPRPAFFGSVRGEPDLAERSEEVLRTEFPGR